MGEHQGCVGLEMFLLAMWSVQSPEASGQCLHWSIRRMMVTAVEWLWGSYTSACVSVYVYLWVCMYLGMCVYLCVCAYLWYA